MATNIPPQNLREICAALIVQLIDSPRPLPEELMKLVRGPDFPTGGIILGRKGIRDAYLTGRGKVIVRAKVTVESSSSGKDSIIVTEIPYQVNKSALIVRIADLVKERKIDGIVDLNDESDRHGMRIVIDLRRGRLPEGHPQPALCPHPAADGIRREQPGPREGSAEDPLPEADARVLHRAPQGSGHAAHPLRPGQKAEERAHILEGLKIALDNIDEVIAIIKKSANTEAARLNLMERFTFSEKQAQAILDMRLQRLTSLEVQKIVDELNEVLALIEHLKDLLSSEQKILGVVKEETQEISEKFGDDRRTEIVEEEAEADQRRGPHHGRGHGHPHLQPRLHQADTGDRLPPPGTGRQGLLLGAAERGRFHRAVLHCLHA